MFLRLGVLTIVLLSTGIIGVAIYLSRKGRLAVKIRRLAGLDAIDEAIGRATEMGAKVHFTPGFHWSAGLAGDRAGDFMAGFAVLSYVAELCAKYGTPLVTTLCKPEMVALAEDITRSAYLKAGKSPEEIKPDVRFLSTMQLAWAAGVLGVMARENVKANIMAGYFAAESLIFAETAFNLGAIQVAGCTEAIQLPFFVVTCDYTMIGEEVYAAGAYLSKDPVLQGSIRGQDIVKLIVMLLIVLGAVLETVGNRWLITFLG